MKTEPIPEPDDKISKTEPTIEAVPEKPSPAVPKTEEIEYLEEEPVERVETSAKIRPVTQSEDEAIPPQFIKNPAIVELLSDALRDSSGEENKAASSSKELDFGDLFTGSMDTPTLTGKLLAASLKDAIDPQPNWSELKSRHKQAEYDAVLIKEFLQTERQIQKVRLIPPTLVISTSGDCRRAPK